MAQRSNNTITPREQDQTAATWVIHDHGGAAPRTDARDTWLAQSKSNQAAYDQAERVWNELADIDVENLRQPSVAANDPGTDAPPHAKRHWSRLSTACAVAAVTLIAILGGISGKDVLIRSFADYSSPTGELRQITLKDGSQVLLDSASAIDVNFTKDAREVTLVSGRASFDVAPASDTVPPFVVHASNSTTRALGTRFDIYRPGTDDTLTVTAIEHQIEVTPDTTSPDTRFVLSPGQQMSFGTKQPTGDTPPIHEVNLAASTSWQNGFLIFDHAKLSDVTATLSRYATGPIYVADSDLAKREVSGMFRIDKIDQAVDFISTGLGASSYSIPHVATFLTK